MQVTCATAHQGPACFPDGARVGGSTTSVALLLLHTPSCSETEIWGIKWEDNAPGDGEGAVALYFSDVDGHWGGSKCLFNPRYARAVGIQEEVFIFIKNKIRTSSYHVGDMTEVCKLFCLLPPSWRWEHKLSRMSSVKLWWKLMHTKSWSPPGLRTAMHEMGRGLGEYICRLWGGIFAPLHGAWWVYRHP